jgi:hypothetical protein
MKVELTLWFEALTAALCNEVFSGHHQSVNLELVSDVFGYYLHFHHQKLLLI